MNSDLGSSILKGEFEQAKEIAKQLTFEELDGEITDIAYEEPSMQIYTFIIALIIENEAVQLHDMAFNILVNPLCHIEGAYFSALFHARRCIELSDQEMLSQYLLYLLYLHEVPDKVVSEEEAIAAAKKILKLNSANRVAKDFLAEHL